MTATASSARTATEALRNSISEVREVIALTSAKRKPGGIVRLARGHAEQLNEWQAVISQERLDLRRAQPWRRREPAAAQTTRTRDRARRRMRSSVVGGWVPPAASRGEPPPD